MACGVTDLNALAPIPLCATAPSRGFERSFQRLSAARFSASFPRLRTGGRVVEGAGLENRCAGNGTVGSNPTLSAANPSGWVAERLKAHAWRACGLQKGLVGSNPTPSVAP